ncbi:MAG: hypothetical protein V1644_01625 [Candidatus Micrarchaeota archaeon]
MERLMPKLQELERRKNEIKQTALAAGTPEIEIYEKQMPLFPIAHAAYVRAILRKMQSEKADITAASRFLKASGYDEKGVAKPLHLAYVAALDLKETGKANLLKTIKWHAFDLKTQVQSKDKRIDGNPLVNVDTTTTLGQQFLNREDIAGLLKDIRASGLPPEQRRRLNNHLMGSD